MKQLLIYFLVNVAIISESKSNVKYCELTTNDQSKYCYAKEILLAIAHSPNQLAVDKSSNTLYFSFETGQGNFVPAALEMDTKKLTVLSGVKDAFAIASNDSTIYFGGNHGISKYENQTLEQLSIGFLDIWWLFVSKSIYFIKFPILQAYYYKKTEITELPELKKKTVHQFVLDKRGHVFFINGTGFYGVQRHKYRGIMLSDKTFSGITVDANGEVYLCNDDGIYVLRKIVLKVKKIVDVQGVMGLTFDKFNNIVYTTGFEISRLVPMKKGPC